MTGPFTESDKSSRNFKRAVAAWAQGDVITGIGQFWATPNDVDPLTGIKMTGIPGRPYRVFTWDGTPADPSQSLDEPDWERTYSIVTSQSCDVAPFGPGIRQHTVQVSPLERYDYQPKSVQLSIERGEYVDLMAVPGIPAEGKWAVNLRISLPVSKAILAAKVPVHGFDDEATALEFSERVSAKYRRPALHDALSGDMTTSLGDLVAHARDADAGWPEMIEQFRLEIVEGTRLAPKKVRVMAIALDKVSAEDRKDLRAWRSKAGQIAQAQSWDLHCAHSVGIAEGSERRGLPKRSSTPGAAARAVPQILLNRRRRLTGSLLLAVQSAGLRLTGQDAARTSRATSAILRAS